MLVKLALHGSHCCFRVSGQREPYSPEGPEEALTTTSFAPPVDIYEDEHNITLKLEVPGIDEKDIDVRIDNNTLTVHGERKMRRKRKPWRCPHS